MPTKIKILALLFAVNIFLNACGSNQTAADNSSENTSNVAQSNNANNSNIPNTPDNLPKNVSNITKSGCDDLKRTGMKLLKTQTYPIDFEPFEKSCFVTFYGAEFDNPPLGAQYYIYRDGKEIFNFPEQFNGGNILCRVEDVSFEDLNKDNLKDIIIVGKCGAKADAYNENMVYFNTGKTFRINKDANMDLMDFSKAGEVKKYVEQHESSFAK
jgi:hypothetical protein